MSYASAVFNNHPLPWSIDECDDFVDANGKTVMASQLDSFDKLDIVNRINAGFSLLPMDAINVALLKQLKDLVGLAANGVPLAQYRGALDDSRRLINDIEATTANP